MKWESNKIGRMRLVLQKMNQSNNELVSHGFSVF